ncbi:MAG: BamA/TamA family outer membrane protein [Alistipes sp.]|jgi:outer membrane protein insertion porin family|nr:BamA/TamA family outer membrane protein [Alistipes sp.]
MKRIILMITLAAGVWSLRAQAPDAATAGTTTDSQADSTATAAATPPADLPLMDYAAPGRYVVREVRVHGNTYYPEDMMRTAMGLIAGDSITLPGDYASEAIRRVWAMRYFDDVQIVTTPEEEGDGVAFDVYLTERPRVRSWKYEGVRKGDETSLVENLKLRPGNELSDFMIDKNIFFIKKYFSDKGFRNAQVTTRIANDTLLANAVNVTFVIDRGPKVRVGAINFTGNEQFSAGQLRRTFKKTHRVNWKFFQANKLKETDYTADKDLLVDFYNSKGFRNAGIVRDSVYPISDKRLGIDITVDEGNRFYYRNVSWTGNTIYTTDYLNNLLGVTRGATYDRKTLHKRLGVGREPNIEDNSTVTALYQNNGYLMSGIEPAEVVVGEDSLDLEIKIFEGEPFSINNVEITGNQRVNDAVIRREVSTYPGELYSRELVMNTIYRLGGMGHFNPEGIAPGINPVTNSLVDVSWNLEEQPSDKMDVSGGWGAGMFVGSVGVQLNNVSIAETFKKGAWRPYPQGQNQQLAIRGQTNGSYYKALSVSFTEPWLGGKKPHSLTLSGYYSAESNAMYIYQTGTQFFRTLGVAAGVGFRLNWPDQYFTLYTEAGYQRYMPQDWPYFIMKSGKANVVTFKTIFSRSSVSQPIFPRYGSEFSLSLTVTPPWSLMDGKNYADPTMSDQERYKMIEYHKWMFKGRMFHPLTTDQKLVLMTKAEFGYLGHYNPNKTSPFEAFRVGGDGMQGYTMYGEDIIGMRGYDDQALVPIESVDRKARVYTKYTIEMRYPLLLQPRSTIYGLVFAEAGNGYTSWRTFNPFQVKRTLGAGVRLFLPIVGMLGFDWGYGFDRPAGETAKAGGKISFTIGQEF